jgi:formate--tetrahydrofolate ligase
MPTLAVPEELLHRYGRDVAKIDLELLERPRERDREPKLILVSAITPTPAGEGKTTTSIGLADGLTRLGHAACVALREPSLGPVMGMKGGGTGGGRSTLEPSERINLHFTGDFHAITSAHNLLAAMLDNHLHFETELDLESRRITWPRVMDMNDRVLRDVVVGLGGAMNGFPRETAFDITAASELMAILCLADGYDDLRARIDRTLIGFSRAHEPITAGQTGATGAMMALLRDALMPNLVRTAEGTPAIVHGGPFANIAHGCSSVLGTKVAMHTADWVVTEAGFGFDLGAEKFYDIKCRGAGLDTAAVVLVATVRALKMHGGKSLNELESADPGAVERGLGNLDKHLESIAHFGKTPVVALNRFAADTEDELEVVRKRCADHGVKLAVADHFTRGGAGAEALARAVVERAEQPEPPFRPLYQLDQPVRDKICAVTQLMYGADDVAFTKRAQRDLREIERLGYANLPVCIAKTQNSLSDDPSLRGRPRDFEVTVRGVTVNAGAGFLVVLTGDILRMPGLPKSPQALRIDLVDGQITGVK